MSSSAWTVCSVVVVVAAIELRMTSWLDRGRPRQFMEMWEKSLRSILFHLLVPDGRDPRPGIGQYVSAMERFLRHWSGPPSIDRLRWSGGTPGVSKSHPTAKRLSWFPIRGF